MSSGGFTKLADRLCSTGLTQRVACEADRRVTYLELTPAGEDKAEEISQAAADLLRHRMLTPLGRDGLSRLAHAMQTLANTDHEQP
jgi:DNA-binding MarR family transcriptional regulator